MITKEKKVFFLYATAIAILIGIAVTFLYLYKNKESYVLVVRIYNALEYSLLVYFFSLFIVKKPVRGILAISVIAYAVLSIFSFVNSAKGEMPYETANIKHILLILIIIYYFFEVMQESVVEPIYQRAIFWISVAFIINSAGNFFLFLFSKNNINDEIFQTQYTIIYTTVTIVKNLLLCASIIIEDHRVNDTQQHFDIDLDSFNPIKNKP